MDSSVRRLSTAQRTAQTLAQLVKERGAELDEEYEKQNGTLRRDSNFILENERNTAVYIANKQTRKKSLTFEGIRDPFNKI